MGYLASGKLLKVGVEFSLEDPQGGIHFVVPEGKIHLHQWDELLLKMFGFSQVKLSYLKTFLWKDFWTGMILGYLAS